MHLQGGNMNTLVVYDSQYGNTKRIAQAIADTLHAFGQAQAVRVDPDRSFKFQGMDLIILGCPTQGFRPTPAMQSFLGTVSYQSLSGLAVACFDTRFRGRLWKSSAAPRMAKQLRAMGVEPIVPPESFFVKAMKKEGPLLTGEVERAASWAVMLREKYEASESHLNVTQ
jgi:flavodoxin